MATQAISTATPVRKKAARFKIQRAALADMPKIHALITPFADRNDMLHRPLSELYENARDYLVIKQGDEVIACASLHIVWSDLAEIKAVAVDEDYQSHGLGKMLMNHCFNEARALSLATVFVLTHKVDYYAQFGFEQVDVMSLPRKVWGECLRCPKFPSCNEYAMVYHLRPGGAESLQQDPEDIPTVLFPMWTNVGRSV
ncbi:MAG: N-acetyltransferase [Dehalococcoidia bacterium]|nr:N-acetyltransferase [Dehalococcoidia bacterium]